MANSYTLTDIANLCHNEIRMIGTLTEFAADSYIKNDVAVVRYKGVVKCNDAFINIKATTTSFDDTFKPFVNEFNTNVIGRKVFIIGKLNGTLGINVDYIALAYKDDYFEGNVVGIPYDTNKFLVADNEYHIILPLDISGGYYQDHLVQCHMGTNALKTDDNMVITNVGWPSICVTDFNILEELDNANEIVTQTTEEHAIYLEAMQQMKEGK